MVKRDFEQPASRAPKCARIVCEAYDTIVNERLTAPRSLLDTSGIDVLNLIGRLCDGLDHVTQLVCYRSRDDEVLITGLAEYVGIDGRQAYFADNIQPIVDFVEALCTNLRNMARDLAQSYSQDGLCLLTKMLHNHWRGVPHSLLTKYSEDLYLVWEILCDGWKLSTILGPCDSSSLWYLAENSGEDPPPLIWERESDAEEGGESDTDLESDNAEEGGEIDTDQESATEEE